MKKQTKKAKSKLPPVETWKTVAVDDDIKYATTHLDHFLEWIKESVPPETKNEDIRLIYDIGYEMGYYDEIMIEAKLKLQVKEKTK